MQQTARRDEPRSELSSETREKRTVPLGLLAVVVAVAVCVGYLVITAMSTSTVYYLTVSELQAKGSAAYNQPTRIGGRLVDGSLHRDGTGRIDTFSLTDGTGTIPVGFHGEAPDLFGYAKDGLYQDAVVEGRLDVQGRFEASQIIVKHEANFQATDGSRPPTAATPGAFPPKRS